MIIIIIIIFIIITIITIIIISVTILTSQGRGALVALKQCRQWVLTPSFSSGHSIETLGSSTQMISPA